jgi:hypothetical protein
MAINDIRLWKARSESIIVYFRHVLLSSSSKSLRASIHTVFRAFDMNPYNTNDSLKSPTNCWRWRLVDWLRGTKLVLIGIFNETHSNKAAFCKILVKFRTILRQEHQIFATQLASHHQQERAALIQSTKTLPLRSKVSAFCNVQCPAMTFSFFFRGCSGK